LGFMDNSNRTENRIDNRNGNGNQGNSNQSTKGQANEQGRATSPDRGNFTVEYAEVQNPQYAEINERFKRQRFIEGIADQLNASISIPENVAISFKECGQPNAFWDPRTRSINMCYELMEQMANDFREVAKSQEDLNDKVNGALTFAFIHELGHCLIDVLKLPSTGREEDAVDQLSTFVLVGLSGEDGERMAINGALSWGIQYDRLAKSGKTAAELDMLWADEHSMDGQRFYNILCWIFGHNPQKYQAMINNPLPEQRAVRCPTEYAKLSDAWLTLLKPYLKDAGAKNEPTAQGQALPDAGGHSGH
ncbi:MAG TPA: DUF4344 domain-containing metallopeptidase, partial [Pyrinomonadaceae bacterium]